jgi:hypothetical protein
MCARFIAGTSHPPERSCSFAQRLDACEANVGEQVRPIGQLNERAALGAAVGPALKEPPQGGGRPP